MGHWTFSACRSSGYWTLQYLMRKISCFSQEFCWRLLFYGALLIFSLKIIIFHVQNQLHWLQEFCFGLLNCYFREPSWFFPEDYRGQTTCNIYYHTPDCLQEQTTCMCSGYYMYFPWLRGYRYMQLNHVWYRRSFSSVFFISCLD